jgi:hypothetical protein
MHEYGTLKPAEVILRRGRRKRENMEGMNRTRYTVSIYGNVTRKFPVQLIYTHKNIKKFLKNQRKFQR